MIITNHLRPARRRSFGPSRPCDILRQEDCTPPGRAKECTTGRRRFDPACGSNFSGGSFGEPGAFTSRFHKIVRRHPPSERQKFATTSSSWCHKSSRRRDTFLIVSAMSCRNGVVCSRSSSKARSVGKPAGIKNFEGKTQLCVCWRSPERQP